MTFVLPDVRDPELSVVMVTFGAWSLTECAIRALVAHTERSFELIVIDNNSPDETRERLAELRNVRVTLNEENRGFGHASNQGASQARSEHLLLLNSDAYVRPGWLEALLEALWRPGVGAAIPRYLHPDGSLQEAGALLAQDGTVLVYGDGDDADRPCYCFRRIVDFGGAACMLVRHAAFEALGGFDEGYGRAYYEDVDLCLRLAQHGLATIYEPRCTVTHVRYGSSRGEAQTELSEHNRRRFAERWRPLLGGRPLTFSGASRQAVIAGRDALATPRVLICTGADEPGVQRLVSLLIENWPGARLTWMADGVAAESPDLDAWLRAGVEVLDPNPTWLDQRLFHYDFLVPGARLPASLTSALARTQPHAPVIPLARLVGPNLASRAERELADVGIAPQRLSTVVG
jgi:GT2 family glycosyltransferase